MGGKVFSEPKGNEPALQTPRMSEAVYTRTRDFCIRQLQDLFDVVVSPPEAPGKADYGDVDTLVQGPRPGFTWEEVGKRLNSRRAVHNGVTHSFAVPITVDDSDAHDEIYAQIDVHVCRPGFIEWECLLDSYGDMWQIVGKFLRPLGLTANDKGLHVRIPEIESSNRAHSMVYLTHDAMDVLEFLGLDVERYQDGFENLDELYRWCASGRFFHSTAFLAKFDTANDRQRMKKRPMFQNFIDEWVPANIHLWRDKEPLTREDIMQQALARFGKQEDYEQRISAWRLKVEEERLWREVASIVAAECSGDVNIVIRGLKRWVHFLSEDGDKVVKPALRTEVEMDAVRQPRWASQISHSSLSKKSLFDWVKEHWREVKVLEKRRVAAAQAERKMSS
ncbi:predicted protein [Uncinocarpus reesii 1704]|uniref:Uncharacterized protein n=1 Tax=Uncinocarpus reesii (strain UAMH 1704) TaxID=336963 RepID=C4JUV2_UNCRE|nr:uncharacterized protein UREG_04905 [Uncinocarpus reesii 1704]EEP80063.1 predicted protein [Uncinocarpus reesii 1704]